jgi:hypothetical protein
MASHSRSYENLVRAAMYRGYPDAHLIPPQYDAQWEQHLLGFTRASLDNPGANIQYVFEGRFNENRYSGELMYRIRERLGQPWIVDNDMEDMLQRLLMHASSVGRLRATDRLQVLFRSNHPYRAASTRLLPLNDITVEMLVELLEKILQSNEEFDLAQMDIVVRWARAPAGGGFYEHQGGEVHEYLKRRKSIVYIETAPGQVDCFAQCLVLGMRQWRMSATNYKSYCHPKSHELRQRRARQLLQYVFGNDVEPHPIALSEIPLFEVKFSISITIIEYGTLEILYRGQRIAHPDTGEYQHVAFLYVRGDLEAPENMGHYHYINKDRIGSLWSRSNFCFECFKGYQDNRHACIVKCPGCHATDCNGAGQYYYSFNLVCDTCHRRFYDDDCLENHQGYVCNSEHECSECKMLYKPRRDKEGNLQPHYCYWVRCTTCKKGYNAKRTQHKCFIPVVTVEEIMTKNNTPFKLYYYDYECFINEAGNHEAVCIVVLDWEGTFHVFDTEKAFFTYITTRTHCCTFIAHNGSKYDMHFVKKNFIQARVKTNDVVNGNTFYSITYRMNAKVRIRFVDSYKFMPFPLREFPKAFGFDNVVKGYFPYRFLTREHLNYIGPMPAPEWFDFGKMRERERVEAERWYEEHKDDIIDLRKMCIEYCKDDVQVLQQGCERYEKTMLDISQGDISAFRYTTLAGLCMQFYRLYHMPANTIAVFEPDDPGLQNEWFYFLRQEDPTIQVFHNYFGVRHVAMNRERVYLFVKCSDVGCRDCFNKFTVHPKYGKRMYTLQHEWTTLCNTFVKRWTLPHTVMRECEWKRMKRGDRGLRNLLTQFKDYERPLCLRDGFYGGRTEVFKLYCRYPDIQYVDYRGLYPSTNTCLYRGITPETYNTVVEFAYPVGHFVRLRGARIPPLDECFGFIWCSVTCPPLTLPFLPERKNGKLIFDNAPKIGVWTTVEIQKAVQLGYVVEHVFEVVHFQERSSNLFRSYINTFVKMKMEATGWNKLRPGCSPEVFVENVKKYMGIELDVDAVSEPDPNLGRYLIGKLNQNSLWGKFAQRDDQANSVDVYSESDFNRYVYDDRYEVLDVMFHDATARTVRYQEKQDVVKMSTFTNIAIAAFTTAYARMRLYQAMEIVGDDLLYCDTDSLIYKRLPGEDRRFQTGPYLGDLANELNEGESIVEFVATGPKSYSYKTSLGKSVRKIKGFTLNSETSAIITHDVLVDMAKNNRKRKLQTFPLQFDIDRSHNIKTRRWDHGGKCFGMDFTKRRIDDQASTDEQVNTRPFA